LQEDIGDSAKLRSARGGGAKVAKTFPEEAMPDIIRLVHANSNSKVFLTKEFAEFWRRKTAGGEEGGGAAAENGQETPSTNSARGQQIAKRKIVDKIQARWPFILLDPPFFFQRKKGSRTIF
jgi:hypothetical protein